MAKPKRTSNGVANNLDDSSATAQQFKLEDETTEVDTEDPTLQGPANLSPSFKGRLNIAGFAFTPEASIKKEDSVGPRRSPRTSVQEEPVSATPSLKRKTSTRNGRTSVSPAKRSRKPS